ncbi:hypothetical protein LCGC14_2491030, partial [marine sediment metagenome]
MALFARKRADESLSFRLGELAAEV